MKQQQRNLATCLLFAVSALFFTVSLSHAGYVYELSQTEYKGGKASEPTTTRIMIEGDQVKMSGFGKDRSEIIFNGKAKSLLMLDHRRKSYTELDQVTIDALTNQLKTAMAQMEEQLAGMPAAQRRMMESAMRSRMPQAAEALAPMTVNCTGETDTIAGYKAEKVELSNDKGKQSEMWVVSWEDLEGSEELANSFLGMSSLFEGMLQAFSEGPMAGMMDEGLQNLWVNHVESLGGFPVMTREFDAAGRLESETVLVAVEEVKLAASDFSAPRGFKRQKMGK